MAAAEGGLEWWVTFTVTGFLVVTSVTAASSAPQETLEQEHQHASIYINGSQTFQSHNFETRMLNFLWQLGRLFSYEHVWPEADRRMQSNGDDASAEVEYKPLAGGPSNGTPTETGESKRTEVSIFENLYWKELLILFAVWIIILVLQIAKNYTTTCSAAYWAYNLLQIPVAFGVTIFEAVKLYKGHRVIASRAESNTNWTVNQLVLCSACGITAGIVGGLLGLGGGFILGPVFLELGIPPQVSSATATFAMTFSASMSVVEYYLLKRFPIPYALYFTAVATFSALVGQYVVRKVVSIFGRASIIIFILAFTIFVSAISLGGVGIVDMIEKIKHKEYMGFENICTYDA